MRSANLSESPSADSALHDGIAHVLRLTTKMPAMTFVCGSPQAFSARQENHPCFYCHAPCSLSPSQSGS